MAPDPVQQDLPEDALLRPDEPQRVVADRTRRLLDLDFTIEQIDLIVHRTDVVHEAEDLLNRGASREFVIGYLRD